MGAVANITEFGNTVGVSRVLSALIAPEFAKIPVLMSLIHSEDIPYKQGTAVKAFRREGSLTAAALVESTALAVNSNGERSDTAVDATAAKAVVMSGISVENQRFSNVNLDSYVGSAARAIGRFVDDQGLALFGSITNVVTASGVGTKLTVDDLDQAQMLILAAGTPDPNMALQFVGQTRAMRNLKADIRTSSGAAFTSDRFLSIFNGPPQANGYFGSLPGIDLYHTASGFSTSGGNNIQALFHPLWAFAGMYDSEVTTRVIPKGSEGLYDELASFYFWATVLWNDGAACEVQSTAS